MKTTNPLYKSLCGRCMGSGRYDRGVCFGCKGAGYKLTSKKPTPKFEVSAIYEDGVRRVMKVVSAKLPEVAIEKVYKMSNWEKFDINTMKAKHIV